MLNGRVRGDSNLNPALKLPFESFDCNSYLSSSMNVRYTLPILKVVNPPLFCSRSVAML